MKRGEEIRFTKHALEKFEMLKLYGFEIDRETIADTIQRPARVDRKGKQFLAIKPLNEKYAIRVVHEIRKGIIVVVTFYPVERRRYGL